MDRTLRAIRLFCQIIAKPSGGKSPDSGHPRSAGRPEWPCLPGAAPGFSPGLTVEVLPPRRRRLACPSRGSSRPWPQDTWTASILVCDVGGGSSEFALVRPGLEPRFASLPLGVLTLSQAHPLGDPPDPKKVAILHRELSQRLGRLRDRTFPPALMGSARLVGTTGAVTTLAAMHLKLKEYEADRVNNLVLTGPGGGADRAHLPAAGGGTGLAPRASSPPRPRSWWPGP